MLSKPDATPPVVTFSRAHRLEALLDHTADLDKAEVLQNSIPPWLENPDLTVLQALKTTFDQINLAHVKAAQVLGNLKPLDLFCKERLTRLLKEKWAVDVDVEKDSLEIINTYYRSAAGLVVPLRGVTTTTSRSLLHAAMENFTLAESESGGLPWKSLIKINGKAAPGTEITPVKFAALCRNLDLGALYQRHIGEVFALPDKPQGLVPVSDSASAADIRRMKLLDLQAAVHMACLKDDISATAYTMLLSVIAQDLPVAQTKGAVFDGGPVTWQGLMIHDICIYGALVFSNVSVDAESNAKCVVYLPNEPRRPVYEYASLDEFKVYLSLKLQVKSYRERFSRLYLAGHDAAVFFAAFDADKSLGTLSAAPSTCLSDFFFSAFMGKARQDALALAVPTEKVDEQEREKAFKALVKDGLVLLNVAALFVPVLGQLMLTAAVVDTVSEVYEGVEDWTHGERKAALSHLLHVVENVAQLAAFTVGGKVVSDAFKRGVQAHTAFFDGFEAVARADGKSQLWKPDLQAYRQAAALPGGLRPDSSGIYKQGARTSIVMDRETYRVSHDSASREWRINHPSRPTAFAPAVERDVEGGWRHVYEHAHEWPDSGYALSRTDPSLNSLSQGELAQVAEITGLTPAKLYRLHVSDLPLPQRLKDCIERIKLDRRITRMISELERAGTTNAEFTQEQLRTLPRLPGWPAERFIEVLDDHAVVVSRFPETAPEDDVLNGVKVSQAQLTAGRLFDTVIAGLDPAEVDALVGTSTTDPGHLLLRRKMASTLRRDPRPLLEWLYQSYDGSVTGDVATLREHAPDLPSRVCRELLENASAKDRLLLREQKIPGLTLVQHIRQAGLEIRQDRALTGLYSPQLADADTDALVLGLMDRVQGWDEQFRLEVRQGSTAGTLLGSVGSADALKREVIVKTPAGYQVTLRSGSPVTTETSATLLESIPHALSASQRTKMGVSGGDHFDTLPLRERLLAAGTADPVRTTRVLRGEPTAAPAHLSSCVQADPPAINRYAKGWIRKVRKLYPTFSDAEVAAFLDSAGSTNELRANRIKELQQQWKTLRTVLHNWRHDEAQMKKLPGTLNDVRVSRRQVAHAIENCWRRVKPARWPLGEEYTTLKLERNPCGQLPTLTEQDVAHVRHLSIKSMNAGDELAYFLKPFKGLVRLELEHNQLTRLPEALSHMPDLEHLRLDANKLALTGHTLRKLADLRKLKILGLSGNRLGATVDVSKMLDLQSLFLADTHTTELPVGLARLPYLDVVNLERNEIRELPAWLFNASSDFTHKLNLRHNPFSQATQARLAAYRSKTGIGMGFAVDDDAILNEQRARDLWMPGSHEENYAKRDATWAALKNEPGSEGFFRTLSEVGSTADNRYGHEDMTRRVWSVIDAVQADPQLREELLPLAVRANCDDSAALIFSNLEMRVHRDAAVRLSANAHDEAARLLSLGRSLFRQDYLDTLAAEKAKADPKLDPVEVALAYRTGLAEKLELVGQPRHMRFASLSGVKPTDLDAACDKVLKAELTSDFVNSISKRDFWEEFLRKRHAAQFSTLDAPFHVQMETALEEETPAGGENPAVTAVRQKHQKAVDALVNRLTEEALKASDAQTCFAFD
ncbi:NEL-type E3 ubiquitin ligase domain-containing protein [Pseudomonas sp. PB3P13]